MKFQIYRPWWYRGQGPDESKLLLEASNAGIPEMCCLGQLAIACGYHPGDIRGIAEFAFMEDTDRLPCAVRPNHDGAETTPVEKMPVRNIITENDNQVLDDHDREITLTSAFGAIGIEVEFTDELPTYLRDAFPEATATK